MLALLADGPLAGREIEIDEPRPTIELEGEGGERRAGKRRAHRYRLAAVELAPATTGTAGERVAVYAHDGEDAAQRLAA